MSHEPGETETTGSRVFSGAGVASRIGSMLGELGVSRVLLVSDARTDSAETVEVIAGLLVDAGIFVVRYARVESLATVADVEIGQALYVTNRCDCIVALGGEAVMNAAKGIGILAENGGEITEYIGTAQVPMELPPLICILADADAVVAASTSIELTYDPAEPAFTITSDLLTPSLILLDSDLRL